MKSHVSNWQRCDGVTRRDLLRVGGLTSLGFDLDDLWRTYRVAAEDNQPLTRKRAARPESTSGPNAVPSPWTPSH